MNVVLDTNILVSALLSPNGNAAKILDMALNGCITLCYDSRIFAEYEAVLLRPKFHFAPNDVKLLLGFFRMNGISVIPIPSLIAFTDEDDRKFYEVATHCHAKLVTGNTKHFPNDTQTICTAVDFLQYL